MLADAAVGRHIATWLVPLGLAGALAAEVVIPGQRLTADEALAIALALPLWALLRGRRWTAAVLVVLLAAALLVERLEPFTLLAEPRAFGWVPFRSVVGNSWDAAVPALLNKLFLYGALPWFLLRAGAPLTLAATGTALLVFATSVAQTYMPSRSGEVTDTLLVLGFALALAVRPPPQGSGPRCVRRAGLRLRAPS